MLNNLRETLQPALEKLGKGFAATGLSPNFWTVVSLIVALSAAVVYGMGIEFGLIIGGILLLVSGFFDMVDGQVARVTGIDIVELNPYHYNGATASLAAKIISTMIAMNLSQK